MLSHRIAATLARARKQLNISQAELARRVRVSKRLVGELERGERPHVGLEAALNLLEAVGVSLVLEGPHEATPGPGAKTDADVLARRVRAAARRQSWSGGFAPLHTVDAPSAGQSVTSRLHAVSQISDSAYAAAAAGAKTRGGTKGARQGAAKRNSAARNAASATTKRNAARKAAGNRTRNR